MQILYEISKRDAAFIADSLCSIFDIPVSIKQTDLTDWFKPLPKFNGVWDSPDSIMEKLSYKSSVATMLLTDKDIYYGDNSRDDEWIFGYCLGKLQVISNARMKREDSEPSKILKVPYSLHMQRFLALCVHELGHHVVKNKNMKEAFWVNSENGVKYPLGPHCMDNSCIMYEVVDIKSPDPSKGHLLIGKEKRFDAGVDDLVSRLGNEWFCKDCKSSISIPKLYYRQDKHHRML